LAIRIGDTVGDYRVLDLIGSGGMGAVYEIEHVITKRVEAMKVLPIGIGTSPENVQRFEREIEVQARLHHPNIVALYNAVRDQHSIALIMEYVKGESLESILESRKLPLQTVVNYAGQVLDALDYAHDKGVIHRDVKPANIIITPLGTAKLMDFGLALAVNDTRLTGTGVAVGSAWYMSPEQVRADRLDARSDIYAMGAVLHEMLTGKKLFDVDGSFEVMQAQMEAIPRPPSALNSDVSPVLDGILAQALAKDPAARFQTANEFGIVLKAALGEMCSAGTGPKTMPAHKAICRHTSSLAFSMASLRRDQFVPSRAAVPLVLALVALVAFAGTLALRHKATRVAAVINAPPNAVSMPAPVIAPSAADPAPADPTVGLQAVEVPTEAATLAAVPAPPSSTFPRQPRKQTFVTKGVDRTTEPMSTLAPVKPSPQVQERASGPAATLATPRVTGASGASVEPEDVAQTPAEGKFAKNGNRFIRALNRLNPFHKGVKSDSASAPKAAAMEGIAR
jgi:serine/threonine-protein kinase